jgi:NAD(P)-dependent dehydrogenase (short-subunit alcohol dehydrogenase family)
MHVMSTRPRQYSPSAGRLTRRNQEKHVGELEGKIALIAGGSSGIGLATAKRFVDEGAHLFSTGRREAELASAVKDICKNVKALKGDVSKLDEFDRIFTQIKEDSGKLDIVFANAGIVKYVTANGNGGSNERERAIS